MTDARLRRYEPFFGEWVATGKILGEGAYGTVYEIRKGSGGQSGQVRALKFIHIPSETALRNQMEQQPDPEAVRRFFADQVDRVKDEIRILKACRGHANIVRYEEHLIAENPGEAGIGWDILILMERLYPISEYFAGQQATQMDVVRMWMHIANALICCEQHDIIHRDIKPTNILVDETGVFKLSDFGAARRTLQGQDASTRIGTEQYMAPEVFKGQKYDRRADYYSLGCVIYFYLNNRRRPFMPPYPAVLDFRSMEKADDKRLAGKDRIPPVPGIPRSVNRILLKSMAYKSADRYKSGSELLADLRALSAQKGAVLQAVFLSPEKRAASVPAGPKSGIKDRHGLWTRIVCIVAAGGTVGLLVGVVIRDFHPVRKSARSGEAVLFDSGAAVELVREGAATEADMEVITEKILAETVTESVLEEIVTEVASEVVTEPITEPVTGNMVELYTEPVLENGLEENVTEPAKEGITEKITEKLTEQANESSTETLTETLTENPSEILSEKSVEDPAEKLSEKPPKLPIEEPTEMHTEEFAERTLEKPTEAEPGEVVEKPAALVIPERPRSGEQVDERIGLAGIVLAEAGEGNLVLDAQLTREGASVKSIRVESLSEVTDAVREREIARHQDQIDAATVLSFMEQWEVPDLPEGAYTLVLGAGWNDGEMAGSVSLPINVAHTGALTADRLEELGLAGAEEEEGERYAYTDPEAGWSISLEVPEEVPVFTAEGGICFTGRMDLPEGSSIGPVLFIDGSAYTAEEIRRSGGEMVFETDDTMSPKTWRLQMELPSLQAGSHTCEVAFNVIVPERAPEYVTFSPVGFTQQE